MEIWKDIPEYEGQYQASNLGRIKSLARAVESHNQFGPNMINKRERTLAAAMNRYGYMAVVLYKRDKTKNTVLVHRLVAKSFIPNPHGLRTVNHKNGIKHDNRVDNLEWASDSDNMSHAFKHGLNRPSFGNAKLKPNTVKEIRELYKSGMPQASIARKFNIYKTLVHKIVHNQIWVKI